MSCSSFNWLAIILIFCCPVIVGAILIGTAFRLRKTWGGLVAGGIGVLAILAFFASVISFGPYFWASYLESRWSPANPRTKSELESFLSLYSKREIQPSESDWGRNHKLKPGEHMTQYLLCWSQPLDVVYRSDDTIVTIYTSYE